MSCQNCIFIFFLAAVVALGTMADSLYKIAGGMTANLGEFPHAVSLRRGGFHFCGGSIISPWHILTAAHCVQNIVVYPYIGILVVAGTNSLSSGGFGYTVKRATVHPDYQSDITKNLPNDIAVITLIVSITFNEYQKAIKLSSQVSYKGIQGIAIGWGRFSTNSASAQYLQKLYTNVWENSPCRLLGFSNIALNNGLVCAIQAKEKGICNGDSGSSLIANGEIVGVASFGTLPCASGQPDYYTKVFAYRSFIDGEMKRT